MQFSDVASLIISKITPDGDSYLQIPTAAPYYSTPFGIRLNLLLRKFSVDTFLLFTPFSTLTVNANDQTVNVADLSRCAVSFHHIVDCWINNFHIPREDSVEHLLNLSAPNTPAGTPMRWTQVDPQNILFDVQVSANLSNCWLRGFYRHPNIAADTDVVQLPDEWLDLFERYCAAYLRENTVQDDVGFQRLSRIDSQLFDAISKIRADRLRDTLYRGPRYRY